MAADVDAGGQAGTLAADTLVLRGGETMRIDHLQKAFASHYDRYGVYWLSVNSVPGMSADDLAKHAARPNAKVRFSTIADLEAAGFAIRETPGRREVDGHCDVWHSTGDDQTPEPEALAALSSAFGEAVNNPAGRRTG